MVGPTEIVTPHLAGTSGERKNGPMAPVEAAENCFVKINESLAMYITGFRYGVWIPENR